MKHYIGPKLYFLKILDHSDVLYTISRYHVLSLPSAIDKKETGKRGRRTKSCSDNLFCRLLTRQVTVVTVLKKTRPKMVCHLSLYVKSSFIDIEETEQLFENTTRDKFLSFE